MTARQASIPEASTDDAQRSLTDYDVDMGVLSPSEQAAYQSVRLGSYTPAEYARETGRHPSTVRTLLHRASRKLASQQ